jgi:superfamily II DNA/RNA helicase
MEFDPCRELRYVPPTAAIRAADDAERAGRQRSILFRRAGQSRRPAWTHMTSFSDLNLNPKVLKAVVEAGYETPTPIQAGAIPPALEGRDVLGIAQTGTGKTASFTLPMITALARGRARARMPRSLVLCPTRELAAQVAENFDTYAKYVKLTKALLIGGVSFKEQDALIDKGVDVLIATPGRLLDHFERGKLILTDVKVMVVDEADRMLDMGFIPDIERIFGLVPFTRQTLFFSATMAPEIERITNTFLSNPERIEVARQATTSDTIEQRLIEFTPSRRDRETRERKARDAARHDHRRGRGLHQRDHLLQPQGGRGHPRQVAEEARAERRADPRRSGPVAPHAHARRVPRRDDPVSRGLRRGGAGLDIPNVSHVFNYDVPSHAEDYVHRIGRTGRAGRKGVAISLAVPADAKYLGAIESLIEQPIPRVEAPWSPARGPRAAGGRCRSHRGRPARTPQPPGPQRPAGGGARRRGGDRDARAFGPQAEPRARRSG